MVIEFDKGDQFGDVSFSNSGKLIETAQEFAEWSGRLLAGDVPREVSYQTNRLLPITGLFGTMSGSQWIDYVRTKYQELSKKGVLGDLVVDPSSMYFDPRVQGREWTADDAQNEAQIVSRAAIIQLSIEKDYESVGSMLEIGFIGLRSYLENRLTIAVIEGAESKLSEAIQRARAQSIADAQYIHVEAPRNFILTNSLEDATQRSFQEQVDYRRFLSSGNYSCDNRIFKCQTKPQNRVCISGTSSTSTVEEDSPERAILKRLLREKNIEYVDTWRADWTIDAYENEEVPLKDKALINTVIISDSQSKGAIKDVGMAVFRAAVNQSYALIYLPEMADSDYTRARKLAIAHWDNLKESYPWISHYVKFVDSMEMMTEYADAIHSKPKT